MDAGRTLSLKPVALILALTARRRGSGYETMLAMVMGVGKSGTVSMVGRLSSFSSSRFFSSSRAMKPLQGRRGGHHPRFKISCGQIGKHQLNKAESMKINGENIGVNPRLRGYFEHTYLPARGTIVSRRAVQLGEAPTRKINFVPMCGDTMRTRDEEDVTEHPIRTPVWPRSDVIPGLTVAITGVTESTRDSEQIIWL